MPALTSHPRSPLFLIQLKLSVVENDSIAGLIERPKDLYDARLGIPNESRRCETCQGTRRGVCDAKLSCDGTVVLNFRL